MPGLKGNVRSFPADQGCTLPLNLRVELPLSGTTPDMGQKRYSEKSKLERKKIKSYSESLLRGTWGQEELEDADVVWVFKDSLLLFILLCMRAWSDWQDDVLQLAAHSSVSWLSLESTNELTTPTADRPQKSTVLLLPWTILCSAPFIFLILARLVNGRRGWRSWRAWSLGSQTLSSWMRWQWSNSWRIWNWGKAWDTVREEEGRASSRVSDGKGTVILTEHTKETSTLFIHFKNLIHCLCH